MNAALRVFSIEVVEAPSIALVVATLSLLGSAELQKLGDSLPLSSQKKCSKPILAQSSMRRMMDLWNVWCWVEGGLDECTAPSPLGPKTDIETSDSLERRHEGRAFIQHGQNRVSGLGRKHQDGPINAGVTIAF